MTIIIYISSLQISDQEDSGVDNELDFSQMSMYSIENPSLRFLLNQEVNASNGKKITHHQSSNNRRPASNPSGDVEIPLYYSARHI